MIMAVAAAHLRMKSIKLAVYLYDWLAQNARRRFLLKNREAIFSLLSQLGFLINKEKKIKPGPYPRYNIHRREVSLRQGQYHAYSRKNCEIKKCNYSFAGRKSNSKAVLTNTRPHGFLHRNYIECKVTNDTNTTTPVVLVESGIQRP